MNYRRNEDMLCYSSVDTPAYSGSVGDPVFSAEDTMEPVALAEVKQHLRIDASETAFNEELNVLIVAARQDVETYLNRSLISRTVEVTMNIAGGSASLPFAPVNEITAVTDIGGNAVDSGAYSLENDVLRTDSYYQLSLTYTAGYSEEKPIPATFKLGIKRLIAWDWENKGDTGKERKIGAITGLAKYRRLV